MPERDRILRHVRKLWALANHPRTEPEVAKAARRKAGVLMFKHRITSDEVEGTSPAAPATVPSPPPMYYPYATVTHNNTEGNPGYTTFYWRVTVAS